MTDYNRGYTSGDKHHHSRSSEKHHGAQDSKKPLFSNMVWTRESAADEDRMAASLLSRIQQGPASLLERISSPKVKSEPGVDPTRGIGDNVDMEEGMMLGNHVNPRRMIQPTSDDLKLADMLIASALADATKAAPKTTTSVSGTAVSDSVATTSANLPRDSNLPAVGGSETHDGGVDVTPSRTELIEQAKQLLIPIITQNARLRDPDADAETIRNRVMSMITDEQCLDFLKIARSVRDQIRSNGRNTSPKDNEPAQTQAPLYVKASMAGNSPLRAHPNETLDARGFSDPVRKSETPGVGPNIIISQTLSRSQDGPSTRSVSPAPTTSTTQAISTMPRLKSPPTAPKAMRLARRTSHSNPSIPSNPAALRIAASPYEAAYQRRHSPAPTAIIAVPSSPRLLRKRSASVPNPCLPKSWTHRCC
ncbi:hypothetical protein BDY19DRAFT_685919 [Irpex rosettiformis]|uniref:Uncharacterized protein n=1 Tax=Irpex rosettiformis TaxID=378272 RepID=A0ACB8UB04_9APHY|nr:hypothetical protein BDY19DRAFT_685919 [Irpex rosettiformis]